MKFNGSTDLILWVGVNYISTLFDSKYMNIISNKELHSRLKFISTGMKLTKDHRILNNVISKNEILNLSFPSFIHECDIVNDISFRSKISNI